MDDWQTIFDLVLFQDRKRKDLKIDFLYSDKGSLITIKKDGDYVRILSFLNPDRKIINTLIHL